MTVEEVILSTLFVSSDVLRGKSRVDNVGNGLYVCIASHLDNHK